MDEKRVVIQHPDGREGAVMPADFGNPDLADNFRGARILRWEDGQEYSGPVTPEGMALKEEREEEEDFQSAVGDEPVKPTPRRREAKD